MKNLFLTMFSFLFLFGSASMKAQSSGIYDLNYYVPNLTQANKQTTLAEIRDFCTNRFGSDNIEEIMFEISDLLNELLQVEINDQLCDRGYLDFTGYDEKFDNTSGDWSTTLIFRWLESAQFGVNFYKSYIDLLSLPLDGESKTDSDSGAILDIPGNPRGKLFIFNAQCGETQSGYFLIIVDRDIEFVTLPDREDRIRKEETRQTSLQVFPNPLMDVEGQLEFYLSENQSATLSIFDGTGKLIQTLFSKKELEKGNYSQSLNLDYPSGIYHVVLQTDKDRVVKKLIKY